MSERTTMNQTKEYIGDGVYAEISKYGELVVTTENGISITNTIIFEDETWRALLDYVRRRKGLSHERD